jgi:tape measure domain-containing protein
MLIRELLTRLRFKADEAALKRFDRSVGSLKTSMRGLVSVAGLVKGAIVGLLAGAVARASAGLLMMADDFAALQGRLKESTQTLEEYNTASSELAKIAAETGSQMEPIVTTFTRIKVAADELGKSNDDAIKLVDTVQKLGIIGGASAEQVSNGIFQLSQGLNNGVLQAEEYNSVLDNMLPVAKVLADELAGGSLGTLKQLVKDQKVTSEQVFDALTKASEETQRRFDQLPKRLSVAMNGLNLIINRQISAFIDESQVIQRLLPYVEELGLLIMALIDPTDELAQRRLDVIFSMVMDAVVSLIEAFVGAIETTNYLIEVFGGLEVIINTVKAAIIALIAARVAGAMIVFFQALPSLIAAATTAMMAFNFASLLNPLVWVPAAIALIVFLAKSIWDATHGAENWISGLARNAKRWAMDTFGNLKNAFNDFVNYIGSILPDWLVNLFSGTTSIKMPSIGAVPAGFNPNYSKPAFPGSYVGPSNVNRVIQNNTIHTSSDPKRIAHETGRQLSRVANSNSLAVSTAEVG